jgi:hypothetical protein
MKFQAIVCALFFLVPQAFAAGHTALFAERAPVALTLRADFAKIAREHQNQTWSAAELGYGRIFQARARSRGNSSLREGQATFPKLLIDISDAEDLHGTIFRKNRKFRINTHVNTHPQSKYTEMGRLNGDLSTWREALAYEIAEKIGFPTPGRRRASITYTENPTGKSFERHALLLETDKNFGERMGMKVVSLKEFAKEKETHISPEDSALLHLFMALIGNEDFVLRTSNEKPSDKGPDWDYGNVVVLEKADGSRIVGPYDFDRSTFAAGDGFLEYSMNSPATPEEWLDIMFERLQRRHPAEAVKKGIARILGLRSEIEQLIRTAPIDEEGRANALEHIRRFVERASAI